MPDYLVEAELGGIVCGIDEAGRGPWAGPVMAAAVVIDPERAGEPLVSLIDDSKKLSARKREAVFVLLGEAAARGAVRIGVGAASVGEIDRLNVLRATLAAMSRAVAHLGAPLDHAIVDGSRLPELACPGHALPGGDGLSLSVAAASIVAKVTRDRTMAALDRAWPGYGFAHNAGYGTAEHRAALERLGVTPHHRKTFAPIHKMLWGD